MTNICLSLVTLIGGSILAVSFMAAIPLPQVDAEIFSQLGQCCSAGTKWSKEQSHCTNYDYAISIPAVWRGLCISTFGICCSKELAKQHCVAGRAAAKEGAKCDGNKLMNTTFYQDCCNACQIGLAVAVSGNNCTSQVFSYLAHDESYEMCCNEINGGTFILTDSDDICAKFPKLCSHYCENTEDSYVCKCRPGYQLDENRVTCTPVDPAVAAGSGDPGTGDENNNNNDDDDDDDDDAINSKPDGSLNGDCKAGYEKNPETHDCEDVDECRTGAANCNDHNQYCFNTNGSFQCLDIKSTRCQDGFRFNVKSEECEDINECLEGVDDCTAESQTCLNSRGGYSCQDKTSTKCMPGFDYDVGKRKCEDLDECIDNPCDEGYVCENLPGNYECRELTKAPDILSSVGAAFPHHFRKETEKCRPGYTSKHGQCIDIDECIIDKTACDSNQICNNEVGSYRCECKVGFKRDTAIKDACLDINECQINNHNCLSTQRCDNTIGSYTCIRLQSCGTGYVLNAETGNCDDDDECVLGTHDCVAGYRCRNTMGSFRCDRIRMTTTTTTKTTTTTTTTKRTTTPPPTTTTTTTTRPSTSYAGHWSGVATTPYPYYSRNYEPAAAPSRPDYSASQTLSHLSSDYLPSMPPQRFGGRNDFSSSSSSSDMLCPTGFRRNHSGACFDFDECQIPHICASHQRCINTNGSYRCENLLLCSGGYKSTPDGKKCADINECETGENNCGPDELCKNRQGGYICSCPAGHTLNAQKRCTDINECEYRHETVCPINSRCVNTIGSYRCECKTGFRKPVGVSSSEADNNKLCIDIDECAEYRRLCEHKCINFWGSYRCACNAGYELRSDNRTCADVNECEIHKAANLCTGYCTNVPGSYECSCPSGYELGTDKNSCRDIDECAMPSTCTGHNEICTNTRGSYRCTAIPCPYGYMIDPNQKNRCRVISNNCEGDECFHKPSAYTYNFITLVSKMMVPPQGRVLFSLKGPTYYENIDFDFKIAKIQAPPNVEKATQQHFSTSRHQNSVELSLMRSLEGPQDIELELSTTVFVAGQPRGKSVSKIIIIVSQYMF